MMQRECQRAGFSGIEFGELRARADGRHFDPTIFNGGGKLSRPRQVAAGQHFVADGGSHRDPEKESTKQVECSRGGESDQRTRVRNDKPFRHVIASSR